MTSARIAGWAFQDWGKSGVEWVPTQGNALLNVLFVHGFIGDHRKTWTHKDGWLRRLARKASPPAEMAELLSGDTDLPPCNYFSIGYTTGIANSTGIQDAGNLILGFIKDRVTNGLPIVFVAHSFGGLACRRAILDGLDTGLRSRIVGLLMLASPNSGTEVARIAKPLLSRAGGDMTPYNATLATLNHDWTEAVVNEGNPDKDPQHRAVLLTRAVVGTRDRVVPPASATALTSFSKTETVERDHEAICKAPDRGDTIYLKVRHFVTESLVWAERLDAKHAILDVTRRRRKRAETRGSVESEKEEVVLETTETDDEGLFKCTVTNERYGGLASSQFNIGIWFGTFPTHEPVDYGWEVGDGIAEEAVISTLTSGYLDRLEEVFTVRQLEVEQDGVVYEYRLSSETGGKGSPIILKWRADGVQDGRRYDRLTLKFESRIHRDQGWYLFESPRIVVELLRVSLTAPFKVSPINLLGPDSKVYPEQVMGQDYVNTARADGPVAPGSKIIWVFKNEGLTGTPTRTASSP